MIFVAMPVCTTMSSLLCQRRMSLAAVAPFFDLMSSISLVDGSSGTVSPSGELANRIACWKSFPIFFQAFFKLESSLSSSDSSGDLLNLLLRLSASLSNADAGGSCWNGAGSN